MKAGPRKGLVPGPRSRLGMRLGTDGSWGEQGRMRVRAGSEVQLVVGWDVRPVPGLPAEWPGSPCPVMGAAAWSSPLFLPEPLRVSWPYSQKREGCLRGCPPPVSWLMLGLPPCPWAPFLPPLPPMFHSLFWPLMSLTQLLL